MRRLISVWTSSGTRWRYVRLGSVIVSLALGVRGALQGESDADFDVLAMPAILVLVPLAILVITVLESINPRVKWRRPSWLANPFSLYREPLQFFHYCAFNSLAAGVGTVLALPFGNLSVWPYAIPSLTLGTGLWAGVWLCVLLFRRRMEDS